MTTATPVQTFQQVKDNPIGLEKETTIPICEGMATAFASFQALYLQYQKHHLIIEGAEFYQLHDFFETCYEEVQGHGHDLGERLNGLGGVPPTTFSKLSELCCFAPEPDDVFGSRASLEHDLAAEQAVIQLLRRLASQAEGMGDRATRYLYEQILLKTEERAYHIDHFLAPDSLVVR